MEDLVRSFTINGAYQIFREDEVGSLEVGKYTDFIMIDRDIFSVDPVHIEDTKVLKTFKNHSKDFWDRVCSVMPDYDSRRIWLKNNGIRMDI